ncbi:MAG: hypothetical protein KZQ83_02040 [gamma proteobacterium symbiont of Taylorina sp.]|nr:hypothetical protein [gamma proteobacterium symbiont of Taylorina sp.]
MSVSESPHYWWYSRFKINWKENPDTLDFSSNLIIAHQIIKPVLKNYQDKITTKTI